MNHELLFSKGDIFSAVHGQEQAVGKRIQSIPPDKILNASERDLVQAVVEEFTLNVPVIRDEDIYIADSGETQVDVRNDPMRLVMDKSRPCYVPASKTVIAVPFTGDAGFFHVRPQQFNLNIPRAEVANDEIRFTYVQTNPNAQALKQEYQQSVKTIQDHLRSLSESAAQFNGRLESLAATQLKTRKDRLLADAGMTAALGLPMKKRAGTPVTYSVPVIRPCRGSTRLRSPERSSPSLHSRTRTTKRFCGSCRIWCRSWSEALTNSAK